MKKQFLSKQSKIVIDTLLVVAFVLSFVFFDISEINCQYCNSAHCRIGLVWILLLSIHIAQQWKLTQILVKTKVMRRNKITALTTLFFAAVIGSILLMTTADGFTLLKFHGLFGRLFVLFSIIHFIQKFKKFLLLFKK